MANGAEEVTYRRGTPARYGGDEGGKKAAPAPADYQGLVREMGDINQRMLEEQTRQNRPDQRTPFASTIWETGPDGRPVQRTQLEGGLGQAATALQGQLAESLGVPLDFSGLPELGTGETARQQAISAALGQAESRLNPRFATARERERTRLLNQGLVEGSEAFNRAMGELGQQETDAYNQALFSAQREGTAAGQALFGQNLASRQQMLGELLRKRSQPLSELQGLQGFTAMPGYAQAGRGQAPDLFGAATAQDAAAFRNWQARMQNMADMYGAGLDLLGTFGSLAAASDERVKTDVERLPVEAVPGVPVAVFRYKEGHGPSGLFSGVVAQDLLRVRPDAVSERDGILYVTPEFTPTKIGE